MERDQERHRKIGGSEKFAASFEHFILDDTKDTFSGVASVFGSLVEPQPPANYPTFILPGAFEKSLRERSGKIKIFREHKSLIGLMVNGYEGNDGLHVVGKIEQTDGDLGGKNTLTLMRANALTELSISFIPEASGIEFVSGSELIERLARMNLNREIQSMIRQNIVAYGERERYRIINKLKLYEVSVVNEGADPNTAINEVHEKVEFEVDDTQKKERRAIDQAAVMDHIRSLADSLVECMIEPDGGYTANVMESDPFFCLTQARYLCSAILTLADMPAMMAEQVYSLAARADVEKHAGRMISTKNLKTLRAAVAVLNELIQAAEPSKSEDSTLQGTPPADDPALLNDERLTLLMKNLINAKTCLNNSGDEQCQPEKQSTG